MTTLHLQTETGHQTASILRQNASMALDELQALRHTIQNLEAGWQGNAQLEFSAECNATFSRVQNQITALQILADRLEREVTEWEQVDQRGAGSFLAARNWGWYGSIPISLIPIAGGTAGSPLWRNVSPPIFNNFSFGQFVRGHPAWLDSLLDRFFKPVEIASPIAEGMPPAAPSTPRTTFGDLLKEPLQATSSAETLAPSAPQPSESRYESYHNVPTKSQDSLMNDRGCVPTSASMIMDYYHAQDAKHQTVSSQDLVNMLDPGDRTNKGMSASNLTDELNDLGYQSITPKVDADFNDLRTALKDGPVIVTTGAGLVGPGTIKPDVPRAITGPGNGGHAMVVVGISTDHVVVNDPWSGKQLEFSRDTFGKMWSNGSNGLYVIRP